MVIIRYHALLRERTGRTEEIYQLPSTPCTTGMLLEAFNAKHPDLAKLAPLLHVAVNNEIVSRETPVNAGDLVDLMPPFGGG